MKVLIVEDDPTQRQLLTHLLHRAAHEVIAVDNGREAWIRLLQEHIQLVITDWVMPDINGIELIHRIRTANLPYYVYVLLLSVRDAQSDKLRGFQTGADDYLAKPIAPEELLARVTVGERILALESNLRTARDQLQFQATHDHLTGLLNRHALYENLYDALERSQRRREPLSVLLFDLDHFKLINDRYGHLIGDQALQHIASLLVQTRRDSDRLGRWGGEEFLIMLPNTSHQAALHIAERLRIKVAATPRSLPDGTTLALQASVGVATATPDSGDNLNTLLLHVDAALYHAKRNGRNQVASSYDVTTNTTFSEVTLDDDLTTLLARERQFTIEQTEARYRALFAYLVQRGHFSLQQVHAINRVLHALRSARPHPAQPAAALTHPSGTVSESNAAGERLQNDLEQLVDLWRIYAKQTPLDAQAFNLPNLLSELHSSTLVIGNHQPYDHPNVITPDTPAVFLGDAACLHQTLRAMQAALAPYTTRDVAIYTTATPADDNDATGCAPSPPAPLWHLTIQMQATHSALAPVMRDEWQMAIQAVQHAGTIAGSTPPGLLVATQRARLMGGTLTADTTQPDALTLYLHLPLAVPADDGQTAADWQQQVQQVTLAGTRIVLIESNPVTRYATTSALADHGAHVIALADPTEVQVWLDAQEPADILLFSIKRAATDTMQLLDTLTPLAQHHAIPLLVWVRVPLRGALQKRLQRRVRGILQGELTNTLLQQIQAYLVAPAPATPPAPPQPADPDTPPVVSRPLRVLVAEDNEINQQLMRVLLQRMGHSVQIVTDGTAVLDALAEHPADVILMDVQMPGMDGIAATRAVRQQYDAADVPYIIGITAQYDTDDLPTFAAAGMNDVLTKPVAVEQLSLRLQAVAQRLADQAAQTDQAAQQAQASPAPAETADPPP